ncbi:HPP family-domain-containing protein [Hygrophoropsis aurantiaca]|uniref:HPP family-domain-containing protein n=1 Tax=Hygrophoropsis aurantiaca TaxID=72124 RepID=A0ACB8ARW8_9AGAM|nr:HPP family-domain-containing protein [Hygrophoropsis aurantiaca]
MAPHIHRLSRLPLPVSRWLGYRPSPPPPHPNYIVWFWSFVAAFCGISVIQAVFINAHYFMQRGVPSIVASYGASAVLIYGSIETPLAQPRALIGGHFVGAFTGIVLQKLFSLLPTQERYMELQWLSGSLSVAISIVAMQMTSTTHPPAGATALLATVNQEIIDLSWYYLPVVLLSSSLALGVALLINNIQRRYPVFWFTPVVALPAKVSPSLGGPETDQSPISTPEMKKSKEQV